MMDSTQPVSGYPFHLSQLAGVAAEHSLLLMPEQRKQASDSSADQTDSISITASKKRSRLDGSSPLLQLEVNRIRTLSPGICEDSLRHLAEERASNLFDTIECAAGLVSLREAKASSARGTDYLPRKSVGSFEYLPPTLLRTIDNPPRLVTGGSSRRSAPVDRTSSMLWTDGRLEPMSKSGIGFLATGGNALSMQTRSNEGTLRRPIQSPK